MTAITFHPTGKNYSQDDLKSMSIEDLLGLRNLVASNLGVAAIRSFKDHNAAVSQTWKALQKYDQTVREEMSEETTAEKPAKKEKAKAEKKDRPLAKPAQAEHVKRVNKKMFAVAKIVKPFDGEEDRSHRSKNYWDGMMIIDAKETEGTMPWDLFNWEKQGYVKITEPTDEEYAERRAAWYKKHGMEDPDLAKVRKAKEREEEKAKKAKEREEAKAAKKAEAEKKKAEKAATSKAAE